jgi:hypothetical protein
MKINILARPALAAAVAVIGWFPAHGMAQDAASATYRCVVQGDTSQCQPSGYASEVRIEKQLVLGPYARYLAQRGENTAAAAAMAQAAGEYAVERTVRITQRHLSGVEKYERWKGGLTVSDTVDETLGEVRVDVRDQRIASLLRDQ